MSNRQLVRSNVPTKLRTLSAIMINLFKSITFRYISSPINNKLLLFNPTQKISTILLVFDGEELNKTQRFVHCYYVHLARFTTMFSFDFS